MKASEPGSLRWCIETDDRIGMVRDIVSEFARHSANLEAMEVVARVICVRFHVDTSRISQMRAAILHIDGVISIQSVEKLPFEADEEVLIRRVMQQEGSTSALSFSSLEYVSGSMRAVVKMARAAARGDMPVLISGESGTGKELLARAIHNGSPRQGRRFVPVNCAAIPDALLESELFGYTEGAFSGATRGGRPGLFEVADEGTLFLDEIGELNPSVQAKLLRALAEGEIRRIGSTDPIHVNVRIVAATNRNLPDQVAASRFREDLYYRLSVMPIQVPPLRQRKDDILPLSQHMLQRMGAKLDKSFLLTEAAKLALLNYRFPGNIRELQNIIERACYLVEDAVLEPQYLMLPEELLGDEGDSVDHHFSLGLKDRVSLYEAQLIEAAVDECGSLRAAAKQLGVTHTTLTNKLRAAQRLKQRTQGGV